jgi:acetylornithine/succinyldiaminopimelate/putrescine aminotransferase
MSFIHQHDKSQTIHQFAAHVSAGKVKFFQAAGIEFVSGKREGVYLWDVESDKPLINCHCNGGVFNLGHRHPQITQTLIQSLNELDIGNHHLISEQRAALAHKLAQLTPALPYTVFGVSGGEAVDLAIKVARGYSGKQKIISARGGYHGHTGLALASGDEKYYAPFGAKLPHFEQIPFNDFDSLKNVMDDHTAAVIFETIPATLGMPIPDPDFYARVRQLCDERNVILILDEVQTGLGRTGKLWGFEHFGIEPDIMVIGKGLSGGVYPMSATCFKAKYESIFHKDPFVHISTFGGAEVGCPVAMKVLEISSDPKFLAHVNEMAGVFAEGFARLRQKHPHLVKLRQIGLMMGIEMINEYCGPLFTKAAYDNGFLSIYANNDTRVAQFLPPLIVDRAIADELIERVDAALAQVRKMIGM